MELERVRPAVLRVTLHAVELGGLMGAARWALGGAKGELPPEARTQLHDLVKSYDAELARLNRRAGSAGGADRI